MADAHHCGRSRPWLPALVLAVLHLSCSLRTAQAQALDYPTAALATTWTSKRTMPHVVDFQDGSQVRSLLLRLNRARFGPSYAFGFYCNGACRTFLLSIFIVQANSGGGITLPSSGFPQVVWAANRGRPVGENATLRLGSDGDLVLADADGTRVWSTGTSGKSVAGVSLTDNGNLVLFGGPNNRTVWDSFSSPTDSLVPGQKLLVGQSLKANSSDTNSSEGLYYLSATPTELVAYIKSATTNRYASIPSNEKVDYFVFVNGSISTSASAQYLPPSQLLRLESDGHLRVYNWSSGWSVVSDLLTPSWPPFASCFYPTACGRYGICSGGNQCACPRVGSGANYFVQADDRKPNLGCVPVNPLSCRPPYNHTLVQLENVAYFTYDQDKGAVGKMDGAKCANLCANNCSCGAAFFQYFTDRSDGNCYLATDVFSLKNNEGDVTHYNSTAFIKVQIAGNASSRVTSPASGSGASGSSKGVILGSALGGALFVGLIVICVLMARKKIRDKKEAEEEEEDLEQVSGMPRRFSFEELQTATEGFKKKLGKGGFGTVYEGTIDGRTVAVKRLDGAHQGKKEFLAEVQTIGKIHHVNLVKLIGFCATKSRRLLVYEFMPNGSLDRWIFFRGDDQQKVSSLDWQTRRKIILGVAKALAYLHEECTQRIAHLDIKPQNILLDERFEAKVSDFGLAKLIDRDQTHVETRMRGTPGYLAPEWLSSMITEKVDVYSFGIVVLEIICGRRNLDRSRPEEDVVLVNLVSRKAASGELPSLVDERIRETDCRAEEEAVRMVQIARGCLQEQNRRPSMSAVVKALEGTAEVDPDVAENHAVTAAYPLGYSSGGDTGSTPLLPSLLSGPR